MRAFRAAALIVVAAVASPTPAWADGDRQWYLADLGIERAWTLSTGSGVIVGLVDSAVDVSCPSLRGAVRSIGAHVPDQPAEHHGTEVASLIVGNGAPSGGHVRGVAPDATILSASIAFAPGQDERTAAAIRSLVDDGASVLNISLADGGSRVVRDAVAYALHNDAVVVAAAGNTFATGPRTTTPAAYPGVLSVTGVDRNLQRDPSSAPPGPDSIAAPMSTDAADPATGQAARGLRVSEPVTGYRDNAVGTSLATAIVTGVVALMRARLPRLTAAEIVARVIASARPGTAGVVDAWRALTTVPVTARPATARPHATAAGAGITSVIALLAVAVALVRGPAARVSSWWRT
jgi:subtilisin family serine protease